MTPLPQFASLVFCLLAWFVLPQQAAAQQTLPPPTVLSWDISRTSFVENELSGVIRLIATPPVDTRINFAWSVTLIERTGIVQSVSRNVPAGVIGASQEGVNLVLMLTNDNVVEKHEEFFHVAVTSATREDGGVVTFDNSGGRRLSITDDETTTVSISPAATVAEGGMITFTVNNSHLVTEGFELAWEATDGTGANASKVLNDLRAQTGTVRIPANNTRATFQIETLADNLVEADEVFTVTLSGPATGLSNVNPNKVRIHADNYIATGTITDTDVANVSLRSTAPAAPEGGTISFKVDLDNPVGETFSLGWAASDGTATVVDDLGDQAGTVEIAANARTATFAIPVINDDEAESSEAFTVALTGAPTGLVSIVPGRVTVDRSSATGTINASDVPDSNPVSIANRTVAENVSGGSIGFTVSLDRAVNSDVVLAVAYAPGVTNPVTLADDLGALPTTVTINRGNTEATLVVPVADDAVVEADETFTVTLGEVSASPLPVEVNIGNGVATGTIANDDKAEIVLRAVADVSEAADRLTFRPELTALLAQDLVLSWSVTGGTASALDFRQYAGDGTVTIPARRRGAPIHFMPLDDGVVEGTETLELTVSESSGTSLPDGVAFRRKTATATAEIEDNDAAVINLRVLADVSETGARLTFRPELTVRLRQDVTVSWSVTGGTTSAADFEGFERSGTVTIRAAQAAAPIQFFPLDDDAVEGPETLEVTIAVDPATPLPQNVTLGTRAATATLADNDDPPPVSVTIDDESVAENVASGTATFTAELTTAVGSDVVLDVVVRAGTATLADDLGRPLPTSVTIDANTTEATFTVPIADDSIVEGDETFTVVLRENDTTLLPDGVTIGDRRATGTITENDTAEVTLTANTATADENGGTFSYTVNLSAAADEAVTVRWTATDGTATVANDLQATTNTVTFAANDSTAQTFTISPTNDNEDEDNETFTVTLEVDTEGGNPLPTGVTIGTNNTATGTIADDDDTPVVSATVSIDDESVAENVSGGNATFTATLSQAVDSPVVLAVEVTAGTATLGVDLGAGLPTTVTIDANTTEATFTVPITDDNIVEGNETFTVTLGESAITPLPDGVTIRDGLATGTIAENDTAEVTLTANTATANENGGAFSYTVSLSAAADEAVTVRWTATDGTAIVANDLQATTGTVTFAANTNTAQTFTIRPVNDTTDEDNETFTVTLGPDTQGNNRLPTGVTIGTDDSSAATIIDDGEGSAATATVSIDDETVAENVAGGTVTFTAALSRAVGSDVVLDVAFSAGTATLATDLRRPLPTTVTIDASVTEATFTVPIADDDIVEGNETFTVTLGPNAITSLPADVIISDGTATGTITEDDTAEVTLTPARATAAEDGTFSYTVSLSAAADEAVTVRWTATDGTATVADDLRATTGTVTFAAGSRADRTFAIRPAADADGEDDETFTVTLGPDTQGSNPLPAGVTIGAGNSSAATITDSDGTPPQGAARVSIADMTAAEDAGPIGFRVRLSREVAGDVTLAVAYAAGSADPGTDLGTPLPATVTIAEGETGATLRVPLRSDTDVEPDETFTVTLSEGPANRLPGGVSIGDGVATGTITNDDEAPPTALEPSALTGPRLIGAGTALRRHAGRFDSLTGQAARNRLDARATRRLSASDNAGDGAVAAGGGLGETRWGAWIDGAWAGFDGKATGRQADVYGGLDLGGASRRWLIGVLVGYEVADLEVGEATYRADYSQVGIYGGARLLGRLLFDGAAAYGMATPNVALGDNVSEPHDASRITARGALTGAFGLESGLWTGLFKIQPQLGALYSREQLGAFIDSAGGVAGREILELGRLNAGPRLTWAFDGGQVAGGASVQWDFLQLEDGVDGRVSGAADIGLSLDLTPNVTLGLQGDIDGIGISEDFGSLGGSIDLDVRF